MALGQVSVAAATAVVDYDLCRDQPWQQSNRARAIRGVALAGSAAALDTKVRILVGALQVGDAYNSATGAPTRDHLFPIRAFVPPGEEVHAIVVDAPATNPINLLVDFEE